jgi:hypothetical protein
MKEYIVPGTVKEAHGIQEYIITAESADDAHRLVKAGKGEFVAEEIEVTDIEFHREDVHENI